MTLIIILIAINAFLAGESWGHNRSLKLLFFGMFFGVFVLLYFIIKWFYKSFIKMRKWTIRFFGLKGSWSWAKRQMMNGKMVRCKHWTGALKFRIDNKHNTLLECCISISSKKPTYGNEFWNTSTHFLKYEDFTDYEVFEWEEGDND